MRKRFIVSVLAMAALVAVAAPAMGQSKSSGKALRAGTRAMNMRAIAKVHGSPQANWTNLPVMNKAVAETGGGVLVQKKLYVPGGFDSTGAVTGQMQIFNTQTNTWSTDPDQLSVLTGLPGVGDAAVCADSVGKIHLVNGTLDAAFIYSFHIVFDPAAPAGSKWSFLGNPNTVVDGNWYGQDLGCTFIGGKMYIYGGYGLTDLQGVAQLERLTWVYDPTAATYTNTNKLMIKGRIWQAYTGSSSRAFVAGGSEDLVTLQSSANTETFTVGGGWKAMKPLPVSLLAPGMGLLGSTLSTFGGGTGNGSSGFTLQTKDYGCVGGACGTTGWVDQNKNLNTARWFTSWGSGGGKLYDAGGNGAAGVFLTSAESTA
jgi:hypothetical protein